ncbi:hypothetical protein VIGAN_08136300 [Vigna angularis var. angularis]|uniref:Uncharacterized protein n=1 Tax=Vigna angularis var. angularis TaxID=157739 RepID=A0A0S3SPI4_PHAAN|nr:hypothetical protein VIGAN_08136300 [Vigna angularis var. angularis]
MTDHWSFRITPKTELPCNHSIHNKGTTMYPLLEDHGITSNNIHHHDLTRDSWNYLPLEALSSLHLPLLLFSGFLTFLCSSPHDLVPLRFSV